MIAYVQLSVLTAGVNPVLHLKSAQQFGLDAWKSFQIRINGVDQNGGDIGGVHCDISKSSKHHVFTWLNDVAKMRRRPNRSRGHRPAARCQSFHHPAISGCRRGTLHRRPGACPDRRNLQHLGQAAAEGRQSKAVGGGTHAPRPAARLRITNRQREAHGQRDAFGGPRSTGRRKH